MRVVTVAAAWCVVSDRLCRAVSFVGCAQRMGLGSLTPLTPHAPLAPLTPASPPHRSSLPPPPLASSASMPRLYGLPTSLLPISPLRRGPQSGYPHTQLSTKLPSTSPASTLNTPTILAQISTQISAQQSLIASRSVPATVASSASPSDDRFGEAGGGNSGGADSGIGGGNASSVSPSHALPAFHPPGGLALLTAAERAANMSEVSTCRARARCRRVNALCAHAHDASSLCT